MKRAIPVLLACLVLTGCASTPVAPKDARPVPAERVAATNATGDAEIVVVRDVGVAAAGCYLALLVNRQLAARMDPGESVRLRVPSGELLLAAAPDPEGKALCGLFKDMRVQREFALKPGETKHFRLAVGPGGMDVMRSDF